MQIICDDQNVRSNAVQVLKAFNSLSLATQARKEEQLVCMMPAIKKAFDLTGDNIIELFTKNESLKNRIGSHDEKLLEEYKGNLLNRSMMRKEQIQLSPE